MTPAGEALLLLAWVTFLLECERVDAIRDMGPLCKGSCYEDARYRFDCARPPQRWPALASAPALVIRPLFTGGPGE